MKYPLSACPAWLLAGLLSPLIEAADRLPTPPATPASTAEAAPLLITHGSAAVDKPRPPGPLAPINAQQVPPATLDSLRPASSDSATLLRDVPGVSLNGAGGISSLPAIRGLGDDRLRIKVDGMDLVASCPNHMNPALSYIDPSNVGSLTVFAGITPVSVGGDSIGGSIIADSLDPEFAAPGADSINQGEVGGFYRSNNNARGGNFSATHAEENFNISYASSYNKADNYTAGGDFKVSESTGRAGKTLPLDEVGSTAYENINQILSLAVQNDNHLLELKAGEQHVPEELFANQRMDMTDNTQQWFNLRSRSNFDWGDLEASAYHEKVDHSMDFGPDKRYWYGAASNVAGGNGKPCTVSYNRMTSCAAGMPMESEGKTTGAKLQANIDLSAADLLRLGSEYQRYRLNDYWSPSGAGMGPDTFENIDDGERDRTALFSEWESRPGSDWLTLIGVRYEAVQMDADDVNGYGAPPMGMPMGPDEAAQAAAFNASDRSQTDNNWDFTALAAYTVDSHLDVEFGYARKARSPNLYERYTWAGGSMAAIMNNTVGDGNGYVGDIELNPETANTFSTTLDWHSAMGDRELRVTPFYTLVNDYIDAVAAPDTMWAADQFNVLQYANQSARLYGVDVSGKLPLASNELGNWGLNALVNYTNGKNRDTDDELYNIMPLNGTFALTREVAGWSNSFEVVAVAAKNQTSDIRNEVQTAGYTLYNLRASHSWAQVRLDFGVENLTDKFYYLPTGGAYTGQGITMGINSIPWGVGVPGIGRSFYTGVNVSF
ncbi:TonB-dependent receptor [Pseudomonas sp. N040]|uniref:TonB-dependent receptor n=1 Tax=Pseudomonas sp. N040 TaxID=2785325 RepID=UPI0018A31AD2|nr:TonB-dependent receptor [Pseudomonas sp. N040]MBF7728803.1 TonB-dependent receptor [Pseudomonas sp. N040]MBW7012443.1 TonB-dependent receptor [Pseudomonas sp. N040]